MIVSPDLITDILVILVLQHSESPRKNRSVAAKLLSSGHPIHGFGAKKAATTSSASGPGNFSVKALRKSGLRAQEIAGATPLLYNDSQAPVRSKFNMKCDVEEIDRISANHLDTSLSPSSIDIDASTGLPSNRVLKTSTSEPSLSMIPLIARCPTDKPCPLSMAPRRRTEQRSLKNQTRYTTPANQILCME